MMSVIVASHIAAMIAFIAYCLASCLYLRLAFSSTARVRGWSRSLVLVGLFFHLCFLMLYVYEQTLEAPSGQAAAALGSHLSISTVCFLLLSLFVIVERRAKIAVLGAFVVPLAAVLMLLSSTLFHLGNSTPPTAELNTLLGLHVVSVVLANVALVFAFAVSVALLIKESLIKKKRFTALQRTLPSLTLLDSLNTISLTTGLILLCIGTTAGAFTLRALGFDVMLSDARFLWSAATISVYIVVVGARWSRGLRGSRAAWLSIAGFTTIVASYISLNLVGGSFHVY